MRVLSSLFTVALLAVGCGDGGGSGGEDAAGPLAVDAVAVDAGPVAGDAGCFENPQTHLEIINACTTAQAIVKTPTLPLLLPDGGLPLLP